jgi:hypothetical protein
MRVNRHLLEVNEDFEHCPTANGGGVADIEPIPRKNQQNTTT